MTYQSQKYKVLPTKSLAFDLIDTDERKEQTQQLLDEFLPHLAAEIENIMHEQKAKLFYEIFTDNYQPKIRVVLKLSKFDHEFVILLNSKNAMFVIGSERGGIQISNALNAVIALKPMLLKLKV